MPDIGTRMAACATVGEQWAVLLNDHVCVELTDATPQEAWKAMLVHESEGEADLAKHPNGAWRSWIDTEDLYSLNHIITAARAAQGGD